MRPAGRSHASRRPVRADCRYIDPAHLGKRQARRYARPMSASLWHAYLLSCADGTLYCGVTNDLPRRLAAHNAGTAAKYTRARLPVRLAASAPCADKSAALRLELAVKKRPRAGKMAFLLAQPGALAHGESAHGESAHGAST